jgi:hypothetical protein
LALIESARRKLVQEIGNCISINFTEILPGEFPLALPTPAFILRHSCTFTPFSAHAGKVACCSPRR